MKSLTTEALLSSAAAMSLPRGASMPRGKHSQQCVGVRLSTSFVIYSKLPDSKTLLLEHTCAFSQNGIQGKLQSFALHIPLLWLFVSEGFYGCS
uniref:Putative secreted protein n=1 Tax=Ixodes ricinus TaxID=34613 RepID=A0A6B0U2Q5_IXORI